MKMAKKKSKMAAEREWIDYNFRLLDTIFDKKKDCKYIIAADFSFSSTGYVVFDLEGKTVTYGEIKTSTLDGTVQQRLWKIFKEFEVIVKQYPCCIFSYEMISVFSNPTSTIKLSMVLAEMFNALSANSEEPPYVVSIATTSLKKAATGHGSSDKNLVLKAVLRDWHQDFDSDDVADAYVAGRIALDLLVLKDIYYQFLADNKKPLEKFLIDFEKGRVHGLEAAFERVGMTKYRFEVATSMMKGGGQSKENDYAYYKESRKTILQYEPYVAPGNEEVEDTEDAEMPVSFDE
jgi:Holliday junction resolvasome RuvABC endonuclease subunit